MSQCGRAKWKRKGDTLRDEMSHNMSIPPQTDVREMAVRMILTREVSRANMAKDLGIGMPTLSRWVRDAIDHSPYGDVLESLHDEVGILRKENAALQKLLFARNARAGSNASGSESPD